MKVRKSKITVSKTPSRRVTGKRKPVTKPVIKPTRSLFRPLVLSRHPSHDVVRAFGGKNNKYKGRELPLYPGRVVIRFGSSTVPKKSNIIAEINTVEAIQNSSSKTRMKDCFIRNSVQTAELFVRDRGEWFERKLVNGNLVNEPVSELPFPIIAKRINGSRARGIELLNNQEEMDSFLQKNPRGYIFEKYYNYSLEYRIHADQENYFYTCRKALKADTPDDVKFIRNDSNCVWFIENNPDFKKPNNWNEIVEHSVKAVTACGLDFGACDIRVSKPGKDGNSRFRIIEVNSAPSFGHKDEITEGENPYTLVTQKYIEHLPKIINKKINK